MYKLRNEKFTYYDVYKEKTPLLSKVTKHKLFTFNQRVIDQFRCQLGTLIENLSHVYKHNRLPNTEILTADTEDTSSNYFTQYTLQDLTQDDLTQEDLLLLTTSPFKESAQKKGDTVNAAGEKKCDEVNAAGEKKGNAVNAAGGNNLAGDIESAFEFAVDGGINATEKGVLVEAAGAGDIESAIAFAVDGGINATEIGVLVKAAGAIDSSVGSDVDSSRIATEKGIAVEAAVAIDSAVDGEVNPKQKNNGANAEGDADDALGGTIGSDVDSNRIATEKSIAVEAAVAIDSAVDGKVNPKTKK